ncbi:hypothetical protein [Streptomyces triculaminicus]|uniref:hypothetical protein n=1 Tax=Streptomyces triculaminicus TaxID=2816232 RepID=UPI0037D445DF
MPTDEDLVTFATIARMAGVGRAAVVNWRRRHGGLDAVGGTEESPRFERAAAVQWLRGLGELPASGEKRSHRDADVMEAARAVLREELAATFPGPAPSCCGHVTCEGDEPCGYVIVAMIDGSVRCKCRQGGSPS